MTINTLNEYNNKYMIHEQFIKFFYKKLILSSNINFKKN